MTHTLQQPSVQRQAAAAPQDLGQSLRRLGRQLMLRQHYQEAQESFQLSLEFEPGSAETCFDLGNLLHITAKHAEAALYYGRAIALEPYFAQAWYNLGVVRLIERDLGKARLCFENALAVEPAYAEAHNNLAILMQASGQIDDALVHYRNAASIQPDFTEPRYNLGLALQDRKEYEECVETYRGLLKCQPGHVDARNNLANVLLELGRPADARKEYERVVTLDAAHPEANWNLGLVQLQLGEWRKGWKNYEWRFRQPGTVNQPDLNMQMPRWDGGDLGGRRILLLAEQGLGDMLQFLRYVPEVVARGGRIIVECHGPLRGIVDRIPGVVASVVKGCAHPEHDCWAPLLSLPAILQMENPAEFPVVSGPYITAHAGKVERWRRILRKLSGGGKKRIGLVWSGNTQFKGNAKRTLTDEAVRALTMGRGERAAFYSLQKGVPLVEGADLIDPGDDPSSLEDAAAIVNCLDLLITVDTSIAHLGGALARPTWTLLAHASDWRWMTGRHNSPWYSSMRLFRQPRRGDWDSVVREAGQELDRFLG